MSLFRKVLLGTGAVIVLLGLIGFLLPGHAHVERTISIDAAPATVFAVVNGFAHFQRWSPWAALDPNAKYTFEGPKEGVGSKMSWVGDPATMGSGSQQISASEPWNTVQTGIDFGPQGKATGTHTLTAEGLGTKVVWAFDSDLGLNPVSRYFGLMFDRMIGADFERGLAGLKKFAESLPKGDFSGLKIETVDAVSQPGGYAGKALKVTHTGARDQLNVTRDRLTAYVAAHALETNGTSWDELVDDPAVVPEVQLRTIIWVPIK